MAAQNSSAQEFSIRVPKHPHKKYQVMRFNSSVNVDFSKWSQVKMERENNLREFRGTDEEMPKYGYGSEYGREAREESRRKKFGIITKNYRADDQPWLLKIGGKTGKKFKGIREGGVGENAAYYVFTHAADGAIEAFPLQEWYNFQPIQRYKALTAEEAEEEFGRRNKLVNYFSLMLRKRLRGDEDGEIEDPEERKASRAAKNKKDLKISEMDDWIDSDDEDDDDDEDSDENEKKKEEKKEEKDKNKKKGKAQKKKKKRNSDDEAFEESDDGDEEGRELDYISDSSEDVSDHESKVTKELQGVAEEDALRKLLSSGEEDEEEEQQNKDKENEDEDSDEGKDKSKSEGDKGGNKDDKDKKNKKKKKKKGEPSKSKKKDDSGSKDSSSELSSDSSDSDSEIKKKSPNKDLKDAKDSNSAESSRPGTPTKETAEQNNKRKIAAITEMVNNKRARLDNFASAPLGPYIAGSNDSGITEDAVRRYLMRKPMTTTELLQKFKSKKTGLTSDQLVNIMTQILKKINPVKQTIKGKMYLSIKS